MEIFNSKEHYTKAALDAIEPISRTLADCGLGLPTGSRTVRTRRGNRGDWDFFRPYDNMPTIQKDVIASCMNAYRYVGILRSVIDMMSEFGSQGIQIVHPNRKYQKLYQYWFAKVRGPHVTERFQNMLYRAGNVILKRGIAQLRAVNLREMQQGFAAYEADTEYEPQFKPQKNLIPIDYTFLNPSTIDYLGGQLAAFIGKPEYIMRIPRSLVSTIRTPKSPTDEQLVNLLPKFIRDPIKNGEAYIYLDPDKTVVYHYKKDDWMPWADPISFSILRDLVLFEKMKLADESALDGIISHIRLWKLGNLDAHINPGPAIFQKLQAILASNGGGGPLDLVWDAAIELVETGTETYKFLGSDKYAPTLRSIYSGLGIPQNLSGGGTGEGSTGSANDKAMSIRTLVERLQNGRDICTEFWNKELKLLQIAFGHKEPARVVYDNMNLYDEANEKMLWIHLVDRDLVSPETLQDKFGMIPEVEQMRIKRYERLRESGRMPRKASPYHDPQPELALEKIALQTGVVSPKDVGLEVGDDRLADLQKEAMQLKQKQAETKRNNKGTPGAGRPKMSKDKQVRKKKSISMAKLMHWARKAQKDIADHTNKHFLKESGKKNVRSLSTDQFNELENLKFKIFWNLEPYTKVTSELIHSRVNTELSDVSEARSLVAEMLESYGEAPTIEDIRESQIAAYTFYYGEDVNGETSS